MEEWGLFMQFPEEVCPILGYKSVFLFFENLIFCNPQVYCIKNFRHYPSDTLINENVQTRRMTMTTIKRTLMFIILVISVFAVTDLYADGTPKLAAPIYPGAVPAVPVEGIKVDPVYVGNFGGMKALDCQGTITSHDIAGREISAKEAEKTGQVLNGPWCFLSRDPIDKVKAFYDKAVGPMHAIQGTWGKTAPASVGGYEVLVERAWFSGEGGADFGYRGVSLHALPPPGGPGKKAKNNDDSWQGQEAYQFYAGTRHFNGFIDAVDWFGDPSKRKPAELNAYYEKHKQLESALFQRRGTKLEEVDEILRARFAEKRRQAEQKAMGMMPGQGQLSQTPPPPSVTSGGTPEDEEFNAFMKKNPKVANRYVELTKKVSTLMQQGKLNEADAADEELQKLIDANPELAALERRADERSAKDSAAGQVQENQAMGNYQKGMDQAVWGTWQEYVEAAEKEAYYTLIVIDNGLRGDEKDYSRDQAVIARDTKDWVSHQRVWDFAYNSQQDATAAKPASSEPQADSQPKNKPDAKDQVEDTVTKGLKSLKKLF